MITYTLRCKCLTEIGDDKGWHYFYTDQENTINESITCPTHPTATIEDITVEYETTTQ